MGMDLYSKRKPRLKDHLYYRFNIWGWSRVIDFLNSQGCDTSSFPGDNSGDVVEPDVCEEIADNLASLKDRMKEIINCPEDQLATHLGEPSGVEVEIDERRVDVVHAIVERRLRGDKVSLEFDRRNEEWNEIVELAYYIGFGDFCRGCAKLGGFRVC